MFVNVTQTQLAYLRQLAQQLDIRPGIKERMLAHLDECARTFGGDYSREAHARGEHCELRVIDPPPWQASPYRGFPR